MSRYAPSDYRPARDRSRSPPRFADRRTSVASVGYGTRASDLTRGGTDAPRGPRSQFDGGRPPLGSGPPGPGPSRGGYAGRGEIRELRDAPPLGSSDRGRPFKDRDFDRRERMTSPRGRSPPRPFRESRDFPRELDIPRARRGSRDGPPSAGSTYSDAAAPFSSAPPFRGGFGRARGRGDFEFRGGRGGRRPHDDRDLFRRDRSPPPPASRWPRDARDISRDAREPERRDDRRFDRRDDERRPEWSDRERDIDRTRRDPPQPRLENRASNDSLASGSSHPPPAPHVNPDRLALLESAGADTSIRRPSLTPSASSTREHRREQPEIPAYLNGRAETTNNRYGSRGSSPPTQAPPVPAFTLSFGTSAQGGAPPQSARAPAELKQAPPSNETNTQETSRPSALEKPAGPTDVPTAPKSASFASKPQGAEPPPAAPKAPRALGLDSDPPAAPAQRLHTSRSWESSHANEASAAPGSGEPSGSQSRQHPPVPPSPNAANNRLPHGNQPPSPATQHSGRFPDIAAPTGPKASRTFPAQPTVSPRMPFASQPDAPNVANPPAFARPKTPPPPTAPSGPRNRAFSVSPKVSSTAIPTAPKANRAPPLAPRGLDRGPAAPPRVPERGNPMQPRAPPTAPRAAQWNQWRRPGAPPDRSIPAKRDVTGEEKRRPSVASSNAEPTHEPQPAVKLEASEQAKPSDGTVPPAEADQMEVDDQAHPRKPRLSVGHSAQQSFFGKPVEKSAEDSSMSDAPEEAVSSSEDDDLEIEDPALFEAKFERQKRELESQLVDLSSKSVRATTPLESIARLARVSTKDLERFREQGQEMDLDGPKHAAAEKQPPSDESEESVVTPKDEESASVAIQDGEEDMPSARTFRQPSPEVINLPYLFKEPASSFRETHEFGNTLKRQEDNKEGVISALKDEIASAEDEEEDLEAVFAQHYRRWREECESLDREKEAEERVERQQSDEPGPEPDVSPNPVPLSSAEGRRLHKFSSEYEFKQVLKQSEETARLEQEKQDIELKKLQADMEKEAVVPDQLTAKEFQRSCFIDNNRLCDPKSLTRVFAYQPPADNFTDHEQQIFIAAYKETPKKWSEIATLLPGRAARDCIRHYYANKWDGRFKDNRRRKAASRRGRGTKGPPRGKGSAAMADMARADELVQNVSDSGRPKRAAAPTTFGEREVDAKNAIQGQSPAKRNGGASKQDGDSAPEKQVKRRKGAGEKPGRKPKAAQQPLAQIAAAPSMSPNNRFIQGMPPKDDPAMMQTLADASLLTGFHTSNQNVHREPHPVYIQESYPQPMPVQEEPERKPAAAAAPTKPSASSYWSVPEQNDFVKYIAYFGTDFAAIAAHMGTKTQTMIKNHYQRQIDGGNRADLEDAAVVANGRRERGEDMGAPPTPTPINKRKYDNPGPTVQRNLAPQADAMDVDEGPPAPQPQASKHASPPQFSVQSRFGGSAQATPIQSSRVAPSPAPSSATVTPLGQAVATARSMQQQQQQPLGSRMSIFGETRPESRPGLPATSSFRTSQQSTPTGQLTQSSRTVQDAHDSDFIRTLKEEQERAIRMQGQYAQQERQERMEPFQHRASLQQPPAHRSPSSQPLGMLHDRKPIPEARPASPPRGFFQSSNPARRSIDSPGFSSLAPAPVSSLASRMSFNPSPPKREEPRSSSVFSAPPAPPAATPAPPPEAPKRSNLLSILNNDSDEPKPPPKRPTDQAISSSMPQRTGSPAQHPLAATPATPSLSNMAPSRREAFGQPSAPPPQTHLQRGLFGQPASGPSPPTVKQEPHPVGQGLQQQPPPPKQDWAARVMGQSSEPVPPSASPAPALEREVRPYFSHHRASALGPLSGPQRHNPSPPPHALMPHSRTPSQSGQGSTQPPREQGRYLPNQAQAPHQVGTPSAQPLQPVAYPPPPPPFSQAPPSQAQNHAHHAHNTSIGRPFSAMHQRTMSREDALRHEQQAFAAHHQAQQQAQQAREHDWRRMEDERRMREDQRLYEERRMQEERMMHERRIHDEREMSDGRRREAAYMAAQEERHRQQQGFSASRPGPPPQMHPTHHPGPSAYDQGQPHAMGMGSLREQSMREAQDLMHQEQERLRRDAAAYRDHEQAAEHARRRHEEAVYPARRTPLGMGGFGGPPPGAPPGSGRR